MQSPIPANARRRHKLAEPETQQLMSKSFKSMAQMQQQQQRQQQQPRMRQTDIRHHSGELPLLRELSALSRAPSLRDPSTSSTWKASPTKEIHRRQQRAARKSEQDIPEADEDDPDENHQQQQQQAEPRTLWESKIVDWIDGGLRDGERKEELLRSIDKLLAAKAAAPAKHHSRQQLEQQQHQHHHHHHHHLKKLDRKRQARQASTDRRAARLPWKEAEADLELEQEQHHRALALRHEQGYDEEDSTTSSSSAGGEPGEGEEEEDKFSHAESPLLVTSKNNMAGRRTRRQATGCANFRFSSSGKPNLPHRSNNNDAEDLEGTDMAHGCGLPWYWSKHKGKSLLELAGRSLSCGYADMPRRKYSGSEMVPATQQQYQLLSSEAYDGSEPGKRHRSLSQKYRPTNFKDMVGQSMLVHALSNAVTRGRIAPVYLFHGPRGTGKTSAARIFAAALNCASDDHRPCGVCRECLLLFLGKNPDVRDVDISQSSGSSIRKLLNEVRVAPSAGRYKVFIFNECQTWASETFNMFLKCLEDPPEHAVFVLTTSEADKLPQPVTSRCQKFLFAKIKESDIVGRLQWVASKENLEVELDALELIANRSNGSLRDAETTLDQLSLVGQKITLPVVQELVGLICNAKLAELLDLALIGDTLNTVRCLRELLDTGIEPLALMSQIATLITDILAGGYMPLNQKGFFQKDILGKEQQEKLRQALKTLSESERQIRSSLDPTTWLTAALLQFAPESCPVFHTSSAGTSASPSIIAANDKETIEWEPVHKQVWDDFDFQHLNFVQQGRQMDPGYRTSLSVKNSDERSEHPQSTEGDRIKSDRQQKLKDTWVQVLEASQSNILKQLLWNHGKLLSISIEGGRAVAYLEFRHPEHRYSAERSKKSISHAFQTVLGFPVEVRLLLPGEKATKTTLESSEDQPKQMLDSHNQPVVLEQQQRRQQEHQQEQQQQQQIKVAPPQAEYLNSRSFPGFSERIKVDTETLGKGCCWELEDYPCIEHNTSKIAVIHQYEDARNEIQSSGRRFKLKTVRNVEPSGTNNEVKAASKPSGGSRLIHSGLLCWKAHKVDEDDDDDEGVD